MITKDVAIAEVIKWLDNKRVSQTKREELEKNIETIASAIERGDLVLNADCSLTQKLLFPLPSENGDVKELTHKARVALGTIHLHMQGVKTGDVDGRLTAYVAAVSGNPKELIKKMDTEDYSIALAIALFFA